MLDLKIETDLTDETLQVGGERLNIASNDQVPQGKLLSRDCPRFWIKSVARLIGLITPAPAPSVFSPPDRTFPVWPLNTQFSQSPVHKVQETEILFAAVRRATDDLIRMLRLSCLSSVTARGEAPPGLK